MGRTQQTTISARIPGQLATALEAVTESRGALRSEVVRRALRYYINENPDRIAALESDQQSRSSSNTIDQFVLGGRDLRQYDGVEET